MLDLEISRILIPECQVINGTGLGLRNCGKYRYVFSNKQLFYTTGFCKKADIKFERIDAINHVSEYSPAGYGPCRGGLYK